jgi:cadmium resistance protein CadD (predicted permease)
MIDVSNLVSIIVYLLVVGGICWLLWWLVGYIGLPEPFNKIARVIIAVVAVVLCINLLLSLLGTPLFRVK